MANEITYNSLEELEKELSNIGLCVSTKDFYRDERLKQKLLKNEEVCRINEINLSISDYCEIKGYQIAIEFLISRFTTQDVFIRVFEYHKTLKSIQKSVNNKFSKIQY